MANLHGRAQRQGVAERINSEQNKRVADFSIGRQVIFGDV
jgi:hypothetical protein